MLFLVSNLENDVLLISILQDKPVKSRIQNIFFPQILQNGNISNPLWQHPSPSVWEPEMKMKGWRIALIIGSQLYVFAGAERASLEGCNLKTKWLVLWHSAGVRAC